MQHFDLAVIGSGTGNSLIDERFEHLSVALIERDETFGGTCLNRGCIPTKMFVLPADLAASPSEAARLGVDLSFNGADWPAIRDRIFGRIDPISKGGLDWRERSAGVTVFHGEASFVFEVLDVVRPREDPNFDVGRELALMVELWRQEVPDRSTTPRAPPA
mgnify:CR=1 FL=1